MAHVEVQENTDSFLTQAKVGEQLGFVYRSDFVNRFDLDDKLILHQKGPSDNRDQA
jgi:hypothetical protein